MNEQGYLVKKDILKVLDLKDVTKRLVVEPRLDDSYITGVGMDLRLDFYFKEFLGTENSITDVSEEIIEDSMYRVKETHIRETDNGKLDIEPVILHKGEFMLAQTLEYISLPGNIMGYLDGRSSLGRRGLLVHSTAGRIDPGFSGHIALELGNIGRLPIRIYPLMRVAHIRFTYVKETEEYGTQFWGQVRIKPPKPDKDLLKVLDKRNGKRIPLKDLRMSILSEYKEHKIESTKGLLDTLSGASEEELGYRYLIPSSKCIEPGCNGDLEARYMRRDGEACLYYICNENPDHFYQVEPPVCLKSRK